MLDGGKGRERERERYIEVMQGDYYVFCVFRSAGSTTSTALPLGSRIYLRWEGKGAMGERTLEWE